MTEDEINTILDTAAGAIETIEMVRLERGSRADKPEVDADLAAVERLRTFAKTAMEIVRAVASVVDADIAEACPYCHAEQGYTVLTHAPDCPVTQARALLKGE